MNSHFDQPRETFGSYEDSAGEPSTGSVPHAMLLSFSYNSPAESGPVYSGANEEEQIEIAFQNFINSEPYQNADESSSDPLRSEFSGLGSDSNPLTTQPNTHHNPTQAHQRKQKRRSPKHPTHTCSACNPPVLFHNIKKYGDQMSQEHQVKIFTCDRCDSEFSRSDTLNKHLRKCKYQLRTSPRATNSKNHSPSLSVSTPSSAPATPSLAERRTKPHSRVNILNIRHQQEPSKVQPPRVAKQTRTISNTPPRTHTEMAPARRSPRHDDSRSPRSLVGNGTNAAGAGGVTELHRRRIKDLEDYVDELLKKNDALQVENREVERKYREKVKEVFSLREEFGMSYSE
ncbi:hypothetical protein TWF730_008907 [Orbilia blumenaviensis]|uniref:C2H2-type domain-containing protein n=1 Tax=Orbilia blumenaviensis TaxID=1796055 RepID=A0AAV9UZ66_9PEZI